MDPLQLKALEAAVAQLQDVLDTVDAHHLSAKPEDAMAAPEGSPEEEAGESPALEAQEDSPEDMAKAGHPGFRGMAAALKDDSPDEDEEDEDEGLRGFGGR